MTSTVRIQLTKSKEKNNITGSVSTVPGTGQFRSVNLTGKLVEISGYATEEICNELRQIDCPTTALINNQTLGDKLVAQCQEIFDERAREGNLNPAVDLVVEAKTVKVRESNIILAYIQTARIDEETQIVDNEETIWQNIAKLKENSKSRVPAQNSIAKQSAGILNKVTNFIKTEF